MDEFGTLLGGEPLGEVVREVEKYDPIFLGINCVAPSTVTTALHTLKSVAHKPLSVYAQGEGAPDDAKGWQFVEENTLDNYMKHVKYWIEEGAKIIGGCCGTSPAYIERLRLKTA